MPDTKITALTAIGANPIIPSTFPIPMVDLTDTSMAASGTTKKVTVNQILGAGGTATLASATITGDLTVRTTGLVVGSTATGIGTTPNTWSGAWKAAQVGRLTLGNATTDSLIGHNFYNDGSYRFAANDFASYYDQVGGAHIWGSSVTSGTAGNAIGWTVLATLNSTGLGVGGSPSYNLDIRGASSPTIQVRNTTSGIGNFAQLRLDVNNSFSGSGTAYLRAISGNTGNSNVDLAFGVNAVGGGAPFEAMRIDSSGNVGIGVTPSAWASGYKGLQIKDSYAGLFANTSSGISELVSNAYNDGAWKFANAGNGAARYQMDALNRTHAWFYAATSVNPITWTQAMTLDASGNLLVKKTASGGTTLGVELLATGQINGAAANVDNLNIYNTTAAAYRFYVSAAGTVFATNTTISAISDARFKENVQDIDVGLDAILALKPRKFDWKDGKGKNIKGDRGFIAQEFETVFPNLIDEWKENAPEGEAPYKSVRQDLIPVLVKAIQELASEVNALKNA